MKEATNQTTHLEPRPQHEVHAVQILIQHRHRLPLGVVAVLVVDADHEQQADHVPVTLRACVHVCVRVWVRVCARACAFAAVTPARE